MLLIYLNRFLCNTSGSGKMCLIFEEFVHHWGIYLTARTAPDSVGSRDLKHAMNTLGMQGKLQGFTDELRSIIEPQNRRTASYLLQAVIYARIFIFHIFLESARAQPDGIIKAHKQLWIFIQVAPTSYFGSDLFLTFSQIASSTIPSGLDSAIAL